MQWWYRYDSATEVQVTRRLGKEDPESRYTLAIGQRCLVDPLFPTNHRNRGRVCTLRYLKRARATVEFEDGRGHRFVRVPLYDLVPGEGHGRGFHGPDTHTGDDTPEGGTRVQARSVATN